MPKKYFWHIKYTIRHIIERAQTTKCIQYNIHDTQSCELPTYVFKSCIALVLSNCVNAKKVYMFSQVFKTLCWFRVIKLFECQKKKILLAYKIHNTA